MGFRQAVASSDPSSTTHSTQELNLYLHFFAYKVGNNNSSFFSGLLWGFV